MPHQETLGKRYAVINPNRDWQRRNLGVLPLAGKRMGIDGMPMPAAGAVPPGIGIARANQVSLPLIPQSHSWSPSCPWISP